MGSGIQNLDLNSDYPATYKLVTLSKLLKLSFLIYNIKYPPCVIEMRSGVWRVVTQSPVYRRD